MCGSEFTTPIEPTSQVAPPALPGSIGRRGVRPSTRRLEGGDTAEDEIDSDEEQ